MSIEMSRGRSLAQIAASLGICVSTLRSHLRMRGYRVQGAYRLIVIPDQGRSQADRPGVRQPTDAPSQPSPPPRGPGQRSS